MCDKARSFGKKSIDRLETAVVGVGIDTAVGCEIGEPQNVGALRRLPAVVESGADRVRVMLLEEIDRGFVVEQAILEADMMGLPRPHQGSDLIRCVVRIPELDDPS